MLKKTSIRGSIKLLLILVIVSCKNSQDWTIPFGIKFKMYPILIEDKVILSSNCEKIPCIKCLSINDGELFWEFKSDLLSELYYNSDFPIINNVLILPLSNKTIGISTIDGSLIWQIDHQNVGDKNIYAYKGFAYRSIYKSDSTFLNYKILHTSGQIVDSVEIVHPKFDNKIIRSPKVINTIMGERLLNTVLLYVPLIKTKSYFTTSDFNGHFIQETILGEDNKEGNGATQAPIVKGINSFWQINSDIMCYDHNAEKQIWRTKLPHGSLTSRMILDGNQVIVPCEDEYLYCINAKTGIINWKTIVAGTPSRIHATREFYYVIGGSDRQIHKLEKVTGKKMEMYNVELANNLERVSFFSDDLSIIADNKNWYCLHKVN